MSKDEKPNETSEAGSAAKKPLDPYIPKKKKLTLYGGAGILILILAITGFLWYAFYAPRYGTIHYGVCKVFAERQLSFPMTMKVRDVEYYRNRIRVYITHIDASGQYRYDGFECTFNLPSPEIISVRLNRDPLPQQKVSEFNETLEVILTNPPDLKIPRPLRNTPLQELWRGGGL